MTSYIPSLRLPEQVGKQINQFFTLKEEDYDQYAKFYFDASAGDSEGDDEDNGDIDSVYSDSESPRAKFFSLLRSVSFSRQIHPSDKQENEDDDGGDMSEDDDFERIGRFPLYRSNDSVTSFETRFGFSSGPTVNPKSHQENDEWPIQKYIKSLNQSWNAMGTIRKATDFFSSADGSTSASALATDSDPSGPLMACVDEFTNSISTPSGGEPSGIISAIQPAVAPPIGFINLPFPPLPNLPHVPSSDLFLRNLRALEIFFGAIGSDSDTEDDDTSTHDEQTQLQDDRNTEERQLSALADAEKRQRRLRIRRRQRRRLLRAQQQAMEENMHQQEPVSKSFDESALRQQIRDIQSLDIPDRERAKRIQELMTSSYYKIRQQHLQQQQQQQQTEHLEEEDDDDEIEGDEEFSDDSGVEGESDEEFEDPSHVHTHSHSHSHDHKMHVTEKDRKPTYTVDADGEEVLGCQHYQRGCKLECSTCNKWYTCRLCHDEVESHTLVRPDTRHMICMHCGLAQDAAQDCAGCGETMANYFCSKCKLWDDDCSKSIYHCDDCGICRIGKGLGKDFFHCHNCNVCMSITLQDQHRCIEDATQCDCPICGEFMFTSTETVVFMRCGHSIHQTCYEQHTRTSYTCPTCSRAVVNMAAQFRILDNEIENQPMPSPYDKWESIIVCNDCQAKSSVPFHFLGLKCVNCGSYNTAQHDLLKPEETGELEVHDIDVDDTINNTEDSTANTQDTPIEHHVEFPVESPVVEQDSIPVTSNSFEFPTYIDPDDEGDSYLNYMSAHTSPVDSIIHSFSHNPTLDQVVEEGEEEEEGEFRFSSFVPQSTLSFFRAFSNPISSTASEENAQEDVSRLSLVYGAARLFSKSILSGEHADDDEESDNNNAISDIPDDDDYDDYYDDDNILNDDDDDYEYQYNFP